MCIFIYRRQEKSEQLPCFAGNWVLRQSTAGAGIDSYYEYLLKAYLLFGDEEYLLQFNQTYAAAMQHLRGKSHEDKQWLYDVSMDTAKLERPWVSSLQVMPPLLHAGQDGTPGVPILADALQLSCSLASHPMYTTAEVPLPSMAL